MERWRGGDYYYVCMHDVRTEFSRYVKWYASPRKLWVSNIINFRAKSCSESWTVALLSRLSSYERLKLRLIKYHGCQTNDVQVITNDHYTMTFKCYCRLNGIQNPFWWLKAITIPFTFWQMTRSTSAREYFNLGSIYKQSF